MVHRLAAGDRAGAADAFLMWNRPPELAGRRRAERAQFLTPDDVPASPMRPAIAGPHLLPRPRAGLLARLVAALTRKAA